VGLVRLDQFTFTVTSSEASCTIVGRQNSEPQLAYRKEVTLQYFHNISTVRLATAEELRALLLSALNRQDGHRATALIQECKLKLNATVMLMRNIERSFTLELELENPHHYHSHRHIHLDQKTLLFMIALILLVLGVGVSVLFTLLQKETEVDAFSAVEIHPNLQLFHGSLAVVKTGSANGHNSVTTGRAYTQGQHYLEFRAIRGVSNSLMIGVQPNNVILEGYPGIAAVPKGRALYGQNGHWYYDGTNANYGLGGYGPGDHVGVLLDMDNKRLTFHINGRAGPPSSLTETQYYFIVNVHSLGDAVEILPKFCWHK